MNTQYPRLRTGPLQPPGLFRLVTLLLLGSLFLTPRLSQAQTNPASSSFTGAAQTFTVLLYRAATGLLPTKYDYVYLYSFTGQPIFNL